MQQEKIWNHFQCEGVGSFEGSATRLRYIARRLSPTDQRVLNVGVGNGYLEKYIRATSHVGVYSLDPSEVAIERLRSDMQMDDDHAKVGYSQAIPFPDGFFDVVIMSEVIEHLDDNVLTGTLKEVSRVLKGNGRYLGTVPADENLGSSQVVCPKCGEIFHRWGHVQSFSRERLLRLIERDFEQVIVRSLLFGNWQMLNWKGRAELAVKKLLGLIGVRGDGENLYFEAVRKVPR